MHFASLVDLPTLSVKGLSCAKGDEVLFQGLNFTLPAGSVAWVAGANGSGKTTLLRTLCGLSSPHSGEVQWCGRHIGHWGHRFRQDILYVAHALGLKGDLSAIENLRFAAGIAGRKTSQEEALKALDKLSLAALADLPVRVLSQGQRKRVALARLVLETSPRLWVLDEPFSALDAISIERLSELITLHVLDGGIVVYTTHQPVALNAPDTQQINLSEYALAPA